MPKVTVYITLKPTLLDTQGRTVQGALTSLGFDASGVRIGKIIEMAVADEGGSGEAAIREKVTAMCDKLLANPVTEDYRIEIEA